MVDPCRSNVVDSPFSCHDTGLVFLGRGFFICPISNISLDFRGPDGAAKKAPSQKDYPASLVKYRRTWERMGSGGLRGPQNRCEACKTSWMCSIHIRSRHTLPALLCSRSCCVPQRRCFVFAWVCRAARFIGDGIWLRMLGFEHADGGGLPYDYRKTGRSFLCRPSGRAVLAHGL